jgi:hypothetical protein
MGQGDEYSRDAYNYDLAYDSDSSDDFDPELHPEDWQDMYSGELLDGWMALRGYADDHYLRLHAGFPDFVNLVLEPTHWNLATQPNLTWQIMWNLIARLPIISDRVRPENFYGWAEIYVGYI